MVPHFILVHMAVPCMMRRYSNSHVSINCACALWVKMYIITTNHSKIFDFFISSQVTNASMIRPMGFNILEVMVHRGTQIKTGDMGCEAYCFHWETLWMNNDSFYTSVQVSKHLVHFSVYAWSGGEHHWTEKIEMNDIYIHEMTSIKKGKHRPLCWVSKCFLSVMSKQH